MSASVVVEPEDPTPPFEQIRRQLQDLVVTGVLGPGERLPPLRQLAGDLGLAVGTVARAYRELEANGLLVSRRGGGTRVAPRVDWVFERPASAPPPPDLDAELDRLARGYLAQALALGAASEGAQAALTRVVAARSARDDPVAEGSARPTQRRGPALGARDTGGGPAASLGFGHD